MEKSSCTSVFCSLVRGDASLLREFFREGEEKASPGFGSGLIRLPYPYLS